MTENNYQRIGSISNAHVGRAFEKTIQQFFLSKGIELQSRVFLKIGIGKIKKSHEFDLGSEAQKIIVECKSHTWTATDRVPSAKMTTWDQAMYYFAISPPEFRKIFVVLRDLSKRRNETLCGYYLRTKPHLIPEDVEFWEFDKEKQTAYRIH
jgi:hypothetical protein